LQQCLHTGLLEEISVHLVPVALGSGVRLVDHLKTGTSFELVRAIDAPGVTSLTYRVLH